MFWFGRVGHVHGFVSSLSPANGDRRAPIDKCDGHIVAEGQVAWSERVALCAAGQSTDLNALIHAMGSIQAEYLDEIEKRSSKKAEKAAAAAPTATSAAQAAAVQRLRHPEFRSC